MQGISRNPPLRTCYTYSRKEYEHADVLSGAIKNLGGDPTALTPAANLAMNISAGVPQVLSDPRTNLLQSLEAIVVAELAATTAGRPWPSLQAKPGRTNSRRNAA